MCSRRSYRRPRSWCGHPWKINRLLKVVPGILSSSTVLIFDRHPSIPTSLVPSLFPVIFPPDPSVRPVHFLFQSLRLLDTLACLLLVVSFVPTRPERRRYSRNYTLFLARLDFFLMVCRTHEQDGKQVTVLLGVEVSISLNSRVDDPTTTGRGRGGVRRRLGWGWETGESEQHWGGGGVTHPRASELRGSPSARTTNETRARFVVDHERSAKGS